MTQLSEILSSNNPLLQTYLFYTSVLVLKILLMAPLTTRMRLKKGALISPEDLKYSAKGQVRFDADVERVRRAHLNDLENIPLFMLISGLYLFTNPAVGLATILFRVYTLARIIHTLVYAVVVIPQPARALSWFSGYGITIYMAVNIILFSLS